MMGDLCTPGNPRELTLEAAKEILRDCVYEGMERGHGRPVDGGFRHRVAPQTRKLEDAESYAGIVAAAVQAQPPAAPAAG
jgi:hypothetical protein